MVYLIKILLILIIISNIAKANKVEKILFSINNEIYTTIDLNKRINYLKILSGKNDLLNNEFILSDFISVLLFNEYAKEYKININEKIINKYLNDILLNDKKKSLNIIISEKDLLKYLRYDYQRKLIIENLLSEKRNSILKEENKVFDIYNFKINYFTFDNKIKYNLDQILEIIDFNNIDLTKKKLNKELIDYVYLTNAINSFDNIELSIKKEIFNNEVFVLKKSDYFLIGKITKEFKKNIELKITFYKITFENEINSEIIVCENLNNIKKTKKNINIDKFDKIEISKLNNIITENLKSINDKILIDNNNIKYYLILCDLNYNSKTSKEAIINDKIDYEIIKIEDNFLFDLKIRYNFKWYE
jgi:hypothetical protein|tara:strand:- start:2404 stop:3486 length:1083 start_codon:yes stop_codon:yes gene_type:complete